MITLIPQTNQEAFDHAVEYFHRTKKQCRAGAMCAYNGPDGTHCVAGSMFVEDGNPIHNNPVEILVLEGELDTGLVSLALLECLQAVHDGFSVETTMLVTNWDENGLNLTGWKALYEVADRHGLDASSIIKYVPEVVDA